ncbi:MAG TPA: chemotaxis protein CheB [Epulopiscium sp.]|nr:chemotaxis protein CheB [Candidatus Epulonipiscium sp.]
MSNKDTYKTIVAIGTSTGGPKALHELLLGLPKDLQATYLIVQHMPAGFTKSLAERIDASAEIAVKEAEDGEQLQQGTAYIAPGGYHMLVENNSRPTIKLTKLPPVKGHRPSVNMMLGSLHLMNTKHKIIGVIMTGMGSDGLDGLMALKEKENIPIIAQNEASCVVYGMPRAVVEAGIANKIVPLNQIANEIIRYVRG